MEGSRQTIARTTKCQFENVPEGGIESIGSSYSHLTTFDGVVGEKTKSVVSQHALLMDLKGFGHVHNMTHAYLAFNRITVFEEKDAGKRGIGVLDLAGNPIKSLKNSLLVDQLIVSSTWIEDLQGASEGTKIIRCGHSKDLKSLKGCPSTVKLIECSSTPNLVIEEKDLPPGLEELITDNPTLPQRFKFAI